MNVQGWLTRLAWSSWGNDIEMNEFNIYIRIKPSVSSITGPDAEAGVGVKYSD